jgi:hypothetical protein
MRMFTYRLGLLAENPQSIFPAGLEMRSKNAGFPRSQRIDGYCLRESQENQNRTFQRDVQ